MAALSELPIEAAREAFERAVRDGPVVVSAPTGSGKSTQIPRWCPAPVTVIEPRRVACRSLAARVAELCGCRLGEEVGYQVRGERRVSQATTIRFVTPGVALLELDRITTGGTVVLDEFHERSLDVDLLLGLLVERKARLVVMSATLESERLAEHLSATRVEAAGRLFPVEIRYEDGATAFPTTKDLGPRVRAALERLPSEGDVLVFLPGKGEISGVAQDLRGYKNADLLQLHGGLSLSEQAKVFEASRRRKIILCTNVAETSLTVPGVRAVIDAGLVRRTRYRDGRAALMLAPITQDSAEQRAGRAGRTAPGVALRLWRRSAELKARTPPEVHRESLVPLVLAAAAWQQRPEALPLLDPAKPHALADAREKLVGLEALDKDGGLTPRGRELFGLPLSAELGALLVSARARGCLEHAIDLVAMLELGRAAFGRLTGPPEQDDPRACGCDATALIRALRSGEGLSRSTLEAGRALRKDLRRAFDLKGPGPSGTEVPRRALAAAAMEADPRSAYVIRRRKRHVAWANGGTEIELDNRSAVELVTLDGVTRHPEAVVNIALRAVVDGTKTRLIGTCALPVPIAALLAAGLGVDRASAPRLERGRVVSDVERVYAKRVLSSRRGRLEGELLRSAVSRLVLEGRLHKGVKEEARRRLTAWSLLAHLTALGLLDAGGSIEAPVPAELEAWIEARVEESGLEAPEDLELLLPEDLLPQPIPFHLEGTLERDYPTRVDVGDARYRAEVEARRRRVTLYLERGQRRHAPPRQYLPRYPGFELFVEAGGSLHRMR